MNIDFSILLVAIFLAVCHLVAPRAFGARLRFRRESESFAGGMAASAVFLHMFAELDQTWELLGDRVHFLVLAGFMMFYGAEGYALRFARQRHHSFTLRFSMCMACAGLLGFTLLEQLPGTVGTVIVATISLGLHTISGSNNLQEMFGDHYKQYRVPWLLAGATLLGAAISIAFECNPRAVDLLTALLAGFLLFNIFREEIPDPSRARFRWFFTGALLVALVTLITGK